VPAGAAGREGRPVAERALVPPERGKDDAAFIRLVAVMKQVTGHGPSVALPGRADIGRAP